MLSNCITQYLLPQEITVKFVLKNISLMQGILTYMANHAQQKFEKLEDEV